MGAGAATASKLEEAKILVCPSQTDGGSSSSNAGKIEFKGTIELANSAQRVDRDSEIAELREMIHTLRAEIAGVRTYARRQPLHFTVGQYNILAGYLGNNTEPWFLYGTEVSQERRVQIQRKHVEKGPDGAYLNVGWPNYVRGILSDEEQRRIEEVHRAQFAWESRKDKLLDVIRNMDADILSIVECDHYEDHFKPALHAQGYDTLWAKRPRSSCTDGCCIAWRSALFKCKAHAVVEYMDRWDAAQKKVSKDRIALITLLESHFTGDTIVFVSTHLARNPECSKTERLRAQQIGRVFRSLADFAHEHDADEAPVILAGDLNATSFGLLRGVASAVALLQRETFVHPFMFDCADVPTGPTSVTTCRDVRIDAIMYLSERLDLVNTARVPDLSTANPIPNKDHPSDHVPVCAMFRMKSEHQIAMHLASEWYQGLAGRECLLPLNGLQLEEAFRYYTHGSAGSIEAGCLRRGILHLLGTGVADPVEVGNVVAKFPNVIEFAAFRRGYTEAIGRTGMPGQKDFNDAFTFFDQNGDGTLCCDEMVSVFTDCCPTQVPEADIRKMFDEIDKSHDGRISVVELVSHLAKSWLARLAQ